MNKISGRAGALVGMLFWLLVASVIALPAPLRTAEAAAPAPTYLLRHVESGQFLAPDGWGPSVLASQFKGRMAYWERVDNGDGTVRFRNVVTGQFLDHHRGTNGHDVGIGADPAPSTAWTAAGSDDSVRLVNDGAFLVANGFTVRTETQDSDHAEWALVPVEPVAARFVALANEASGRFLATGGPDGAVVTADVDEPVPAIARWELIEQVTTNRKCDQHPDWNIPNDSPPAWGDTSRVATCFVLRDRANGEVLDADSADSGYAVTTQAAVTHDAYWVLSDIAAGVPITLKSVAFPRYLADLDGAAVTSKTISAASRWRLRDVGAGCAPLDEVRIESHQPGDRVDTSEAGNATGSFRLFGTAPLGTTAVAVAVAGETGVATIDAGDCAVAWTIEVAAIATQRASFGVVATGTFGERRAGVDLDVVAPAETDVLLQPTFADTPQFAALLMSFDSATGTLVFSGDISQELAPGDGLGGGISPVAPDGYLRVVLTVQFDGTNTVVTTRQAGLTEFVRQIELHYRSGAATPVAPDAALPQVSATEATAPTPDQPIDSGGLLPTEEATADTSSVATSALAQLVPIGDDVDLNLEFNMDPGADFDLDIGWHRGCWFCIPTPTVELFGFEVRLDLSARVEFIYRGATLAAGQGNFGPRLDDFRFATISVPTPIGIPIVLTFEAESQPFYEYSIDAVARIEYGLTFSLVAGYEHKDDGTGRGAYRDATFDAGTPGLEFDLGILATVAVGLEVDVEGLLYGQAGIEIEARPQLELEAIGDLIDREVNWELRLVVPFEAGVEVEIELGPVGWELELGDLQFLELSFTLLEGTFGGTSDTTLAISQIGPPGVFPNQEFAYTTTVRNTGATRATDVRVDMALPTEGSFVSSSPPGFPAAPPPGAAYSALVGDLDAGATATVILRWRAPAGEGTVLTNTVTATADNSPDAGPVATTTVVGVEGRCNPCGAAAAGVGLRNRSEGTIQLAGLPEGATVTRAVLTWGILYNGAVPGDTITLGGIPVTADLAATVSGNLCWGDSLTIGYAADVTALVQGNGSYTVSDPPRGITRVDADPAGVLPYTDGASLVVFYVGGGANNQVISDFTYNTNTDASGTIVRSFTGINSVGASARLTVAGPDGQNNGSESFAVAGAGTPITLTNTHDGSDPQEGPSFGIGNLWDTDRHDVTSVLPAGQTELTLRHTGGTDCIGISAAVLEVAQG